MDPRQGPEPFSQKTRLLHTEDYLLKIGAVLAVMTWICALFFIAKHSPVRFDFHSLDSTLPLFLGIMISVQALIYIPLFRSRKQWRHIEKNAIQDSLTQLPNRMGFEKMLEEELRRGGRYHYPVTLCYLDIDDFKGINDRSGRENGDHALRQFAILLKSSSRFADCAARYQNDEFCLLLPHTDIVRAEKYLARLARQIEEKCGLTFSGGVTSYQNGETRAQFMMRAHEALMKAKREGRKKIRYAAGDDPAALNF